MRNKKLLLNVIMLIIMFIVPIFVYALGYGDVNNDGKVTSQDYIVVRKAIMKQSSLSSDQKKCADMNKDGKVTSQDYILIRKKIMSGDTKPETISTPTATPTPSVTPTSTSKPTSTPTSTPTPTRNLPSRRRLRSLSAIPLRFFWRLGSE